MASSSHRTSQTHFLSRTNSRLRSECDGMSSGHANALGAALPAQRLGVEVDRSRRTARTFRMGGLCLVVRRL